MAIVDGEAREAGYSIYLLDKDSILRKYQHKSKTF